MAKSLKKSGGCSSTGYAGISDNYMLLDKAMTKGGTRLSSLDDMFGGGIFDNMNRRGGGLFNDANLFKDITGGDPNVAKKDLKGGDPLKKLKGGNPTGDKKDLKGGDPLKKLKGGNPTGDKKDLKGGDPLKKLKGGEPLSHKDFKGGADLLKKLKGGEPDISKLKGGDPLKKLKGGDPLKKLKGGEGDATAANPMSMLGFGSAMKGFTDNLTSLTNIKGGNPKTDNDLKGGVGESAGRCSKGLKKTRGGTTGIELAPFISSLIMLGLRAANDKTLQSGITKKLGSMVSESKKSKSKSKSKRASSVDNVEYY
jgi:hypothetical protein